MFWGSNSVSNFSWKFVLSPSLCMYLWWRNLLKYKLQNWIKWRKKCFTSFEISIILKKCMEKWDIWSKIFLHENNSSIISYKIMLLAFSERIAVRAHIAQVIYSPKVYVLKEIVLIVGALPNWIGFKWSNRSCSFHCCVLVLKWLEQAPL